MKIRMAKPNTHATAARAIVAPLTADLCEKSFEFVAEVAVGRYNPNGLCDSDKVTMLIPELVQVSEISTTNS